MGIKRKDLEAGGIDLARAGFDRRFAPLPPGATLQADFLEPLAISAYRLAKNTGLPPSRVSAILNGKRAITADTALRFGRFFGVPGAFFLHLQAAYDMAKARHALGDRLDREVEPLPRRATQ